MSSSYTITITPTIDSSGNYTVSATDSTSTYTYTFSLPTTTTLYGNMNCGNTLIGGFLSTLNYTDTTTTPSTNYVITTGNYFNSSMTAFDPTSTCPAYITINNINLIETYSYGSCSTSLNSSISFSLTGANVTYTYTYDSTTSTPIYTFTTNNEQNLSITPSTTIPLSSTANCSNFKTLKANPINGNSYTNTYTFNFNSSPNTILISITSTYNNGWTLTSITIDCFANCTNDEISISIATLCALYYSSSYYEYSNSNTTTCLNFISGIMLIAPTIQLFSLQ
jgi:hypothetical protein